MTNAGQLIGASFLQRSLALLKHFGFSWEDRDLLQDGAGWRYPDSLKHLASPGNNAGNPDIPADADQSPGAVPGEFFPPSRKQIF